MKTKEELNVIKEEIETLNNKLRELTEEELAQVTGGNDPHFLVPPDSPPPEIRQPGTGAHGGFYSR